MTLSEKYEARVEVLELEHLLKSDDLISRSHFDERIRQAAGMVLDEMAAGETDIVDQILAMLSTEPSYGELRND